MLLNRYFRIADKKKNEINWGLDILLNLRLRASNPNDPYEFFPNFYKPEYKDFQRRWTSSEFKATCIRKMKKYGLQLTNKNTAKEVFPIICSENHLNFINDNVPGLKKLLTEKYSFFSFSSHNVNQKDEILLWSYYSSDHRGLRITFDTEKFKMSQDSFIKVKYQENPIGISMLHLFSLKGFSEKERQELFDIPFHKSKAWEYECEYRKLISLENEKNDYFYERVNDISYVFLPCPPESIVFVDLGYNAEQSLIEEVKSIPKDRFPNIKIRKAALHQDEFKLKYLKLE